MLEEICVPNDSKMVLFVIDGLGGIPKDGKTELETAHTPNLDALAMEGTTGLAYAIGPGITPGSGPAHLSLFGYDPVKTLIGRGVLEALGLGITLTQRDVAVRGNFCTLDDRRVIIDRRAGRIATEMNREICKSLSQKISQIEDVEVRITPGEEHRFVVVFRGDGLDDRVSETDPQKVGATPLECIPQVSEAAKLAAVVNEFVRRAEAVLVPPANGVLMRGFSKRPNLPTLKERFGIRAAAIAAYPMYKGLADLVGMQVLETGHSISDAITVLERSFNDFDFFFLHYKKTDSLGEDGDFDARVRAIEEVDAFMPRIRALNPTVLVVTCDHSTPALLRGHSWHPSPFLLWAKTVIPDRVTEFGERACMGGGLGHFNAIHTMPLMLAHAMRLRKYGA